MSNEKVSMNRARRRRERRHAAGARSRPMSDRGPTHGYRAYGLRIHSDVVLPFDPLPDDSIASEPDVTVRLGPVPRTLPAGPATTRTPRWQARSGAFLMHVEDIARFLVTGGRDVLIELLGDDDDVAALFVNFPFTALLQQRGLPTLHAAAVATDTGAVLLLGPRGIGKSSLVAALVECGFPLLADDVTGVTLDAGHRPVALPAFARQRLWTHTLDRMRWRERGAVQGAPGVGEILGAGATRLRLPDADTRRLRAGVVPSSLGHSYRAPAVRQRLPGVVGTHPPQAGDGRDGAKPRAFPRHDCDGAAHAGGAGDEVRASVPARSAGGAHRSAPA